jgi:hypothetical protein
MDLNFTSEELAFRDEVRAFLREQLPSDIAQRIKSGLSPSQTSEMSSASGSPVSSAKASVAATIQDRATIERRRQRKIIRQLFSAYPANLSPPVNWTRTACICQSELSQRKPKPPGEIKSLPIHSCLR